ncbi:MAG: subclass B3 metallo-beta-lactamase [Bryobacteraceae bacterium]
MLALLSATVLPAEKSVANPNWNRPVEPYRVIANIYYVGTNALASFLITTPAGHFLINSGFEESVPLIQANVEKLGFKFTDIRYLLNSQAHDDHVAGNFMIKELTTAKVLVMDGDQQVVENGGKGDFDYSTEWKPCKVDRVLHDGETVPLGGTTLTARKTPGHTRGCTTWTTAVLQNGQKLNVVIVGGTGVNTGYKLVDNAKYPNIASDYAHTFEVLRFLPCDVFLGAHPSYYDGTAKAQRLKAGAAPNPFIDPAGYTRYVDDEEKRFRDELARQQRVLGK